MMKTAKEKLDNFTEALVEDILKASEDSSSEKSVDEGDSTRYRAALERIANLDGRQYYLGVPDGYSRSETHAPAVTRIDITVDDLAAIAREALGTPCGGQNES